MQENMLQISLSNYQDISIDNNFNAMFELFYYIINKFQIHLKLLNEYNIQTYFHIRILTKHKYNVQNFKNTLYVFMHHQFEKNNAPPIKVLKSIS
jgi:hypothetical protein